MTSMKAIQENLLKYSISIHGSSQTCLYTLHMQEAYQSFGDLVHCSIFFRTMHTSSCSLTITKLPMVLILTSHCSQLEWSSGVSCCTLPLSCSCTLTNDSSHLQIIILSSITGHHLKLQTSSSLDGSTQ